MGEELENRNAKIIFSSLVPYKDFFYVTLGFDYGGIHQSISIGIKTISMFNHLLDIIGAKQWDQVLYKFVRVICTCKEVLQIGNILEENKWVSIETLEEGE